MVRTRRQWWNHCIVDGRGTDGSQVHIILMDWKESEQALAEKLVEIRDAVRAGYHGRVPVELTKLIDELQPEEREAGEVT